MKSDNGEVTSRVLPHFQIPVRAIFGEQVNREILRAMMQAGRHLHYLN